MIARTVEGLAQAGHLLRQLGGTDRGGRLVTAAGTGLRGEVELAVVDLAHPDQAFAERIEAIGLGLEFAEFGGQRVDFALRGGGGFGELVLLAGQLAAQTADFGHRDTAAGEKPGREAEYDHHGERTGCTDRQLAILVQAKKLRGLQEFRYDDDIHA